MTEPPHALKDLGEELDRVARRELPDGRGGRLRLPGRRAQPLSALAIGFVLLLLAAAATAAVLLIKQGSPLPSPHAQDLRSSGIPLSGSARLAGLDAPDPDASQPPWDLRLSRTRNGETCTAVGQVVDGRFGIVGLDHVFRALPLGGVDACGIDTPDGPILAGARDFVGRSDAEARTVVSGVAGRGARSVSAYTAAGTRPLKLGPDGSFITVYAGAAEDVRPRIVVVTADGHSHTVAFEQPLTHEIPDPDGGSSWEVSGEPDLQAKASPDEDCVQASQLPSQREPSRFGLPLTPEVCGRLSRQPLIVLMRRFVPGERATPFPWGNAASRTLVYGIAAPRVASLTLEGAGAPHPVSIARHGGGAFLAVLDGHADPRLLTLRARLRDGRSVAYKRSSSPQLLEYLTNRPLPGTPVPAYREPAPARMPEFPPFELPISSTVRETLKARDPAGGPRWVERSWQGQPNQKARGAGRERYVCAELGIESARGLLEPSADSSTRSQPLSSELGRCNPVRQLLRMHYMLAVEGFLDDPYAYAAKPGRAVVSGVLPPGASNPVLVGAGPPRHLRTDANNAFLLVLPGIYWRSSPRITYLLHGHRVGRPPAARGLAAAIPRSGRAPQTRAPDPDGGAPWGFAATARCGTAVGHIVEGRLAGIEPSSGVLTSGAVSFGSRASCITRPGPLEPPSVRRQQVEFAVSQNDAGVNPFLHRTQELDRPEIERRTLPGRTIITGVARADVVSITLVTPSDVRTLRPAGPLHTVLAVYDGFFLRGGIAALVRLRDGRTVRQTIQGIDLETYRRPSLGARLRAAEHQAASERSASGDTQTHASRTDRRFALGFQELVGILRRRLDYERAHPGLLPSE